MDSTMWYEIGVQLTVAVLATLVMYAGVFVLHRIVGMKYKSKYNERTVKGKLTQHHYKCIRWLWQKEFNSIQSEVQKRCEEIGVCKDGVWQFGSCHTRWKIEQELMKDKFGIFWPTPQDLEPNTEFD